MNGCGRASRDEWSVSGRECEPAKGVEKCAWGREAVRGTCREGNSGCLAWRTLKTFQCCFYLVVRQWQTCLSFARVYACVRVRACVCKGVPFSSAFSFHGQSFSMKAALPRFSSSLAPLAVKRKRPPG